jgi:DNA-binding FadR family transcriptional regulator
VVLDYNAVVTTSVAKQIAEGIRQAIVEGRIKVGERLPTEDELAKSYQVSRPTIREALKRLASQNLVHSRRGPSGGNFVTRPDSQEAAHSLAGVATLLVGLGAFELDEIVAARLEMESVCARLAAKSRTEEHLAAMEAELVIQRSGFEAVSDQAFCDSDVRFHRALVEGACNAPLGFMMHVVVEAMVPITNLVLFRVRERRRIVHFHELILEALRRRDGDGAVSALGELMSYLSEIYQDVKYPAVTASGGGYLAAEARGRDGASVKIPISDN